MAIMQVSPAYGKDYRNKDDLMAGYHAGHDFYHSSIMGSGYVNKQDHPEGTDLVVRYGRGMKMHTIPSSESKKEYKAKAVKAKKPKLSMQEVDDKLTKYGSDSAAKVFSLSEEERKKYSTLIRGEVDKVYGNRQKKQN